MNSFKHSNIDFVKASKKDIVSFIDLKKEQQNNLIKKRFKLPFEIGLINTLEDEINFLTKLIESK